ncbi:MAG: HAMP domain-containing histidine kinase [Polaromonas sp.]|nr:HAMP domain-containing histidine kinase [Polaromonas sp.]
MLHLFLSNHREALISRCMLKVAERSEPESNQTASQFGIPLFLDQLIQTLEVEKSANPSSGKLISGPAGGHSESSDVGKSATRHGRELSDHGFTIEQLVHDYGDLCQAITDLAVELGERIEVDEFRTFNRCLDNAIADAVTEFSHQRRLIRDDREEQALNHRLGVLVHELRVHINAASHAVSVLKSGQVGFSGATASVLDRSLAGMRTIVDRSIAVVRLTAGLPPNHELVSITDFIADVKDSASFEALARKCEFSVSVVGIGLAVEVDRDLLFSAVANLLQNAFKFTGCGTKVSLTAYAEEDRVLIDVQDHCGGLGPVNKEDLFRPFNSIGAGKPGTGLGLSISRRSVEANKGMLSVRDIPGSGCVFTISLPRHPMLSN